MVALLEIFKLSIFLLIPIFTKKSVYFSVSFFIPYSSDPNNNTKFPSHFNSVKSLQLFAQNHKSKNYLVKYC